MAKKGPFRVLYQVWRKDLLCPVIHHYVGLHEPAYERESVCKAALTKHAKRWPNTGWGPHPEYAPENLYIQPIACIPLDGLTENMLNALKDCLESRREINSLTNCLMHERNRR